MIEHEFVEKTDATGRKINEGDTVIYSSGWKPCAGKVIKLTKKRVKINLAWAWDQKSYDAEGNLTVSKRRTYYECYVTPQKCIVVELNRASKKELLGEIAASKAAVTKTVHG